jgi:serine/threonine protein phosphatase PrpC
MDIDAGDALCGAEIRTGELVLTVAGGTDIGRRYRANFDVLHVAPPLLAVADGMGDGEGSAAAGRTAVGVLAAEVQAAPEAVGPPRLRAAVAKAQRKVGAIGDQLGQLAGCTLTALVTGAAGDPHAGWLAHIGDSRAYRFRGGLLELLTVDHTVAWLGAINGWYPADSPAAARARYQLTRYVGHPGRPEPDVLSVTFRPGDVYCLCTDGLAEQVSYHRVAQLLSSGAHPSDIVTALLADARAAGGRDNATVVLLRIEPAGVAVPPPGSVPLPDPAEVAIPTQP